MRNAVMSLILVATLAIVASASRSAVADPDEVQIRAAVESYFDGLMHHDAAALERAFHPESRLLGVPRGGLTVLPFERWKSFTERDAPERDLSLYENRIVSIDTYGTAAMVKVDLTWPDVHYVDYLSLLEIDGEWKIVNKIWHQEPPEAAVASD